MYKNVNKLNKASIRLNSIGFRTNKGKRAKINKMLSKQKYSPVRGYTNLEVY